MWIEVRVIERKDGYEGKKIEATIQMRDLAAMIFKLKRMENLGL